jgi:hypothetical protein
MNTQAGAAGHQQDALSTYFPTCQMQAPIPKHEKKTFSVLMMQWPHDNFSNKRAVW